MNSDPGFARPRIRKLLPALAEAGISANRIASASAHLSRARLALDAQTQTFLAEHSHSAAAGIALDGEALARVPREIGLRAIAAVLIQMSGRSYRPRFERLERLFDGLHQQQFRRQTLAGCCISRTSDATAIFGARTVWVVREKARKTAAGYRRQNGPGPDLPDPSSEAP